MKSILVKSNSRVNDSYECVLNNESYKCKTSDSEVNDSYEWLLLVNPKTELDQWSLIPELMTLTKGSFEWKINIQ